jgi:hypothetical protein
MLRRRSIVFGSLFVAGIVAIAWTEYYPSSGMFAALGMPGPSARNGRVCGYLYSEQYSWQQHIRRLRMLFPTRSLKCSRVLRWASPMQREEVEVDALNRNLLHAERMWDDLDSAQWQRERDSIASGFVRRGGHEITCAKSPYVNPIIRDTRFWRFSKFSVRLVAYKWEQEVPGGQWLLQLDGYPTLPDECVYDPWRVLTPAPDVCAEAVFRMPLPFDRRLCVRTWLWN